MAMQTGLVTPENSARSTILDKQGEEEFQMHLLQGVSRTFALTIPQLPTSLRQAVSNAYLLCRTIDTIEDEPHLSIQDKRKFCRMFVRVLSKEADSGTFVSELAPLLSENTIPAEKELIRETDRVVRYTHDLEERQQQALIRCVSIMSEGMIYFQENESIHGLTDLKEMDRYCYYVAGVVGEMLTDLFCHHNPEMQRNYDKMMAYAPSFGQGLQMTNILKDIWEDYERDACWMPRAEFVDVGFDLSDLGTGKNRAGFERGLERLIGVAHAHLRNAMEYTLMIPPNEAGIRKFCLWALGMAVMTLQKINKNRTYKSGKEVKISRKSVKAIIVTTQLTVKSDWMLKKLFDSVRKELPLSPVV